MDEIISKDLVTLETIQSKIYEIRGVKVILDFDLAIMYQVETKYLKRSVKANIKRFPKDFMFELSQDEWDALRCKFCTSKSRGGIRYKPYAFTEQGVAMLSGLLNSDIAINVNIAIMRAFVAVRQMLYTTETINREIIVLKERMKSIERGNEETLEAVNDLSEDVQKDLDEIYMALSALSNKVKETEQVKTKPRNKIGFKH